MEFVEESGLTLGPFQPGHFFRVEGSTWYAQNQEGLKVADLVHLDQNGTIDVIEVKTSAPRPASHEEFEDYFEGLGQKFSNTWTFTVARILGRHCNHPIDQPFQQLATRLAKLELRFTLIVKDSKRDWLPDLQDKLRSVMRQQRRLWDASSKLTRVLNEDGALRLGIAFRPTRSSTSESESEK